MIIRDNKKMENESNIEGDQMLPLEDANDDGVEYLVEGDSFMVRRALSAQIKEDELEQKKRKYIKYIVEMTIQKSIYTNSILAKLIQ